MTTEKARLKRLEREMCKLCQANEILKKHEQGKGATGASLLVKAYFAMAEPLP